MEREAECRKTGQTWCSASDTVGLDHEGEARLKQKTLCAKFASSIFCAGLTPSYFLPGPPFAVWEGGGRGVRREGIAGGGKQQPEPRALLRGYLLRKLFFRS